MDMSWNEIIAYVLSNVLKVVIALVIPFLVRWVVSKIKNDRVAKYVKIAGDVVSKCVAYIDQIYVDNLKEDGMFDVNAQKKAFEMCKDRILVMLTEEAKKAIITAYGDFEEWLTNAIEHAVRENKFSYIADIPAIDEAVEGE